MKMVLFTTILLLGFHSQAQAAWSGKLSIKSIKATSGGVDVILSGFTNNSSEVVCTHNSFVIAKDSSNYEVRSSFILSAYMAKEKVNISYYGCMSNGQIKAGSVLFQ